MSLRKKYLGKAQIYLYEADLLFYFIDITNKRRFEESIEYLDRIRENLNILGQNTPIVYILSKGDSDVLDTSEVRGNISRIKKLLIKRTPNGEPGIYITSIFEIFTILRAFSYGIAKLSPNRDLIKHKLDSFAKSCNVYLTLLLTNEGLVLADQFTSKALALTRMPKSEELISVFEITAPQFAILFKIFSKYRNVEKDEAIFKVANSVILFKKFRVEDYDMFLLFLIDDEDKKEKISKHLPMFLEQTQDLLLRFIS